MSSSSATLSADKAGVEFDENAEGCAIATNSQGIVETEASDSCAQPMRKPAVPGVSTPSDDSLDDSVVLAHVRALAIAAHTLVAVDPERSGELLQELMRLLDERTSTWP
jgi:hypothetical protein